MTAHGAGGMRGRLAFRALHALQPRGPDLPAQRPVGGERDGCIYSNTAHTDAGLALSVTTSLLICIVVTELLLRSGLSAAACPPLLTHQHCLTDSHAFCSNAGLLVRSPR
jgi:hypothetical protein